MGHFAFMVPCIEILAITVTIYFTLSSFWNTRAIDLFLGIGALLAIYAVVNWLSLPVLQHLLLSLVNVTMIALLIIFQPELRLALSKLSWKSRKFSEITEFDRYLESLTHTIYRMSEKRIGAIILLENQDSLAEYANQAVQLNAQYSPELIESIFSASAPLHDGAVIMRGDTIIAAATILPLADDTSQLLKSMGTRHRAALGISQLTDSLIIVISEESGKVSIAREGIMTRGVKPDRFKGIIRSIYDPPKSEVNTSFKPMDWLQQWYR